MTSEPPRPSRRIRPDASFRRQALGGVASEASAEGAGRVSADGAEPAVRGLGASSPPPLARHTPATRSISDQGAPPRPSRRRLTSTPPPPPLWRRLAFGIVLVALFASIPVLVGTGYDLVTGSTDGEEGNSGAGPKDPGYEELVTSTPTAVVVQTDAEGAMVGLTFLALGSESGGGTVIFVPLGTSIPEAGFGVDRLRLAYRKGTSNPDVAAKLVSSLVGELLNVGIDEVIQLDDEGWANAVDPVAPFDIDNLDSLDIGGVALPAGPVELGADLVGPYLGKLQEDESELSRLSRQEQVWRGWLQAVAASGRQDAVPGESGSGLGLFANTLAGGPVTYAVLPGIALPGGPGNLEEYEPDKAQLDALVVDAVPAPDAGAVGSRRSVRLLNGVVAGPIPGDLIRKVASVEGSVEVVGNGPSFGREKTTIVYTDPKQKAYAAMLQATLGATGQLRLDREAPDDIDVTVLFGRDLLDATTSADTTTAREPVTDPP